MIRTAINFLPLLRPFLIKEHAKRSTIGHCAFLNLFRWYRPAVWATNVACLPFTAMKSCFATKTNKKQKWTKIRINYWYSFLMSFQHCHASIDHSIQVLLPLHNLIWTPQYHHHTSAHLFLCFHIFWLTTREMSAISTSSKLHLPNSLTSVALSAISKDFVLEATMQLWKDQFICSITPKRLANWDTTVSTLVALRTT